MNILVVIIIVNVMLVSKRESFRYCGIEDVYYFLDNNVLINIKSFKISGYQVSLVVSGSSSRSDDRGSNPAPTTEGHLRSRVR